VNSFGSGSGSDANFELITGLVCNLDPFRCALKLFDSPNDLYSCHLILDLEGVCFHMHK